MPIAVNAGSVLELSWTHEALATFPGVAVETVTFSRRPVADPLAATLEVLVDVSSSIRRTNEGKLHPRRVRANTHGVVQRCTTVSGSVGWVSWR